MAESDLQLAMKVLEDQRAIVNQRDTKIAMLNTQIDDLKQALIKSFGSHGYLIGVYTDPKLPADERRRAAQACLPYERARVGGLPQQHQHFHLFAHLEAARLKKREAPR